MLRRVSAHSVRTCWTVGLLLVLAGWLAWSRASSRRSAERTGVAAATSVTVELEPSIAHAPLVEEHSARVRTSAVSPPEPEDVDAGLAISGLITGPPGMRVQPAHVTFVWDEHGAMRQRSGWARADGSFELDGLAAGTRGGTLDRKR